MVHFFFVGMLRGCTINSTRDLESDEVILVCDEDDDDGSDTDVNHCTLYLERTPLHCKHMQPSMVEKNLSFSYFISSN